MTTTLPLALPPGFSMTEPVVPPIRDPMLILAYSGWSDGGDAATTAASYLCQTLSTQTIARMDCEDYFDFTVVRPEVRLDSLGRREVVWPDQEFYLVRAPGGGSQDLLISFGEEPHLRWRSFARAIAGFARAVGVRRVLNLGAFLADVIYSRPIEVAMSSADPEWVERFDLPPPRYEGPTGILSAIGEALGREAIASATLWAPIPHYVTTRPNPRGALALLEKVEHVAGLHFDLGRLRELAASFDDEVSAAITGDPQLSAYVRELKRRAFSQ